MISDINISDVGAVIQSLCDFSHRVADTVVLGYATAQTAPIEQGEGKKMD